MTQYSHLLKGSVKVYTGQRVNKGDVLGFVGLSGNSEFPHVDFSVTRDGKHVDPFNPERAGCGVGSATLWSAPELQSLRYQATGLLISGFSAIKPDREKAESGGYPSSAFSADAESLLYWVELFGVRKNDQLSIALHGPNLRQVMNHEEVLSGNKAVLFSYAGKRRGPAPWPKGTYSALFRLVRSGKIIVEERRDFTVR
jgi:murein DD-endopeptidase MepM/ murein hydrolase activator NlpD